LLSPSRSSRASREPVEAPEGAQALPTSPLSRITSALTVGLPRESRTSQARMSAILVIGVLRLIRVAGRQVLYQVVHGFPLLREGFELVAGESPGTDAAGHVRVRRG